MVIKKRWVRGDFFESGDYLKDLDDLDRRPESARDGGGGGGLICVLIQLPVDHLRHLALKTVLRNLRKKEDCFRLPNLPQCLQFELADMFH